MVHCGIDGMRVLSCRRREEGEGEKGRKRMKVSVISLVIEY